MTRKLVLGTGEGKDVQLTVSEYDFILAIHKDGSYKSNTGRGENLTSAACDLS